MSSTSSSDSSSFPCPACGLKLVVFDMAGTTVDDTINGEPLVTIAFMETFSKHHSPPIQLTPQQINPHRGKSKKEAIKQLLLQYSKPPLSNTNSSSISSTVNTLFHQFELILNRHINSISKEQPGTTPLFKYLKEKGVLIAVGSGFSEGVVQQLVTNMGWNKHSSSASSSSSSSSSSSPSSPLISYLGSVDRVGGRSRPDPAMVIDAMKVLSITDPSSVLKIGDTVADIEEGKNAGVKTIGVTTGTQSREKLEKAGANWVCDGMAEIERRMRERDADEQGKHNRKSKL